MGMCLGISLKVRVGTEMISQCVKKNNGFYGFKANLDSDRSEEATGHDNPTVALCVGRNVLSPLSQEAGS